MTNPTTFKTIHDSFISIIKNTEPRKEKIELFVNSIDPSVTLNDKLKDKIETCLYHLNAQNNRDNKDKHTQSELFKIYFPNLRIQENDANDVSYIEEDDAITIKRSENRLAAPAIKNDKEEREEAILAYKQAMSNKGPLYKILIELGMTKENFDNDFQFKGLLEKMYTSQTFFYENHRRWMESLEYFSELNLGENNNNIIFILYASELTLAKHPNKRELMLKLYLSIVTGSIRKSQKDVTFYNDRYRIGLNSIFKDDYPDIYNASTEIFNDIISDKRFKDISTLHKKIITFDRVYYPTFYVFDIDDTERHPLTSIHRSLTYIVFILSFANILPMIPAIVALGSLMLMINTFFHYRIYSNFKKDFSIFDNTGQTTKTFITNLILSSLLIITTTSVFVSLVLNSYPMIALLTCAFCMFLSFNTVSHFTNSYEKISMSIIKNHKDEIEQDKSEYTKLIDDFLRNPNSSSPSKNNSLALVEDNLLFGGSQQTGNPSFNKGFRSPK